MPILPQYLRELELAKQELKLNEIKKNVQTSNQTGHTKNTESKNINTLLEASLNESSSKVYQKNESLTEEGSRFGFILGSKPLVQLIVNPFVESLAHKYGHLKFNDYYPLLYPPTILLE